MSQPDLLQPNSLDWAKAHISRMGDSDIFPVPFEFEAIWADWTKVRQTLAQLDLRAVPQNPYRRLLIPKSRHGFRVAFQLDPVDALVYAAIGRECAEPVEQFRVPTAERVACSYRIAPTAEGSFFAGNADGWNDFQSRSKELMKSAKVSHVATADISDFYNQIYHHRVQSALYTAIGESPRPTTVEKFLGRFSAKQSRGIPVGPSTSIILAEACLDDVDKHLISRGFIHTRYVDDFRVFCRSEQEAFRAIHGLTEYLFTAHRLSLQGLKTRIRTAKRFVEQELVEPEEKERDSKIEEASRLIRELVDEAGGYGYHDIDVEHFMKEHDTALVHKALVTLFKDSVQGSPIHIGHARYVLRRAAALRARVLVRHVVRHLDDLMPVFRDAMIYLDSVWHDSIKERHADAIEAFVRDGSQGWLPFARDWVFWFLSRRDLFSKKTSIGLAEQSREALGLRPRALMAKRYGEIEWVRTHKENWISEAPWDRRAILWAGSVLPREERNAWMQQVAESNDLVDAAVAKFVRQAR